MNESGYHHDVHASRHCVQPAIGVLANRQVSRVPFAGLQAKLSSRVARAKLALRAQRPIWRRDSRGFWLLVCVLGSMVAGWLMTYWNLVD